MMGVRADAADVEGGVVATRQSRLWRTERRGFLLGEWVKRMRGPTWQGVTSWSETESRSGAAAVSFSEREFLDEAFERALDAMEAGTEADIEALVASRPELLARVEALLATARDVAVVGRRAVERPEVPGYEIVREIGRGATGVVYFARQGELGGRTVALKVLSTSVRGGAIGEKAAARITERFQAEVNAVARLRHPNIVTVYDIVRAGPVLAYAMEPIDGPSAHALVEHLSGLGREPTSDDVRSFLGAGMTVMGRQPCWEVAARLGLGIARALAAVHGAGLLHRDVKPSNILLRSDGTALLSDFGLVRDPTSGVVTRVEGFVGTPAYASPEQLLGDRAAMDHRSDIYALGATLYHMLTLRRPHDGHTPVEVLESVKRGAPAPRRVMRAVPRDLETIVMKAMAPSIRDRYQSADAFAGDLERLLASRPIDARRPGPVRRAAMLLRRNRQAMWGSIAGVVGAAVLAFALVLGVVVLPERSREAKEQAWITLLDPRDTFTLANAGFFEESYPGPPVVNRSVVDRAIRGYERSVRFSLAGEQTLLELDALRTMQIWDAAATARFSPRLARRAPAACAWMHAWSRLEPGETMPPIAVEALANDDLLAIGMMSYVTDNAYAAIDAWLELERRGHASAYMRAGLGLYFLYAFEPARAYPRIREADAMLPGFSFLKAAHAEAALHAGEIALAEVMLAEARELPHQDAWQLVRIGVLIDMAHGRVSRVAGVFELNENISSLLTTQCGPWLARNGHAELAAMALSHHMSPTEAPPHMAALIEVAEAWWEGLTRTDRERALAEAITWTGKWVPRGLFRGYCEAKDGLRARKGTDPRLVQPHELETVSRAVWPYLLMEPPERPLDPEDVALIVSGALDSVRPPTD